MPGFPWSSIRSKSELFLLVTSMYTSLTFINWIKFGCQHVALIGHLLYFSDKQLMTPVKQLMSYKALCFPKQTSIYLFYGKIISNLTVCHSFNHQIALYDQKTVTCFCCFQVLWGILHIKYFFPGFIFLPSKWTAGKVWIF